MKSWCRRSRRRWEVTNLLGLERPVNHFHQGWNENVKHKDVFAFCPIKGTLFWDTLGLDKTLWETPVGHCFAWHSCGFCWTRLQDTTIAGHSCQALLLDTSRHSCVALTPLSLSLLSPPHSILLLPLPPHSSLLTPFCPRSFFHSPSLSSFCSPPLTLLTPPTHRSKDKGKDTLRAE